MRKIIAGNWKMHHGPAETRRFFGEFAAPSSEGIDVVVFPPAISLSAAQAARGDGSRVALGVQNIHWEASGAFSGEISAEMAAEAGATYTLVGHSERRKVFHETDEETRRKVEAAYRAGLEPVLCLGETLEERKAGRLAQVVVDQLDAVLASSSVREGIRGGDPFVVAYEPVWAIGTGETATPDDAAQAHTLLRERLSDHLDAERAENVSILYGGSVKPENAEDLLAAPDVDGVLVGGASRDPGSFSRIAAAG